MPKCYERGSNNKVNALSTHLQEREEKILQVLECLAEESAKGTPIIVEGKNDIEALRALGVEGKIISAKTGENPFSTLFLKWKNARRKKSSCY